ncbi:MFS transporter [Serratia ficaria]|uniref:Sulfonamide resistance protein n=1 Tax=Serratia ficaria TaxID=61651 RepID=A0A240AFC2_SERFI|nr:MULTISPECIES: MFS transporter [Serratia]MEE4483290.1 MFS transporter [Serratia ficaria]REF42778.1 putative MFS family arabinose efflux permease [Serratia ficaria]CAI1054529.1 Sulfonamide resistance protein [Serratia ficaria]CAI1105914.1 Sulfonamide resistance protein [Serratia ficaria]CAI1799222.1 Sulfonamide resistance protein [Serratia ficaria]
MSKAACAKRNVLWSIPARTMTLACLLVFMAQMATTVYLPALPTVMRELAMSRRATELSISIFVIGAALPVLFWGAAADRFGRRLPLTLSLVLFITCSGLLAFCHNGVQLLTLRAVQGVAAGGAAIIARIIVRDNWSGDELARRLSVLSVAFIAALGGGQFIGGLLSQYAHWQMGFVLMGLTGLAILLLMATLPLEAGRPAGQRPPMAATYFAILRRPGFFWPACVGGLGFAIAVTLQEVSPFVMQQGFGLNVTAFGALGLVIGIAYFSGAMAVNRTVARVGGKRLMQIGSGIVALATAAIMLLWWSGLLVGLSGMTVFIALYCLTIFGQAVLFPNSMAMAVSDARAYGAYAMALCGFLQQCLAGVAAAGAVLLEHQGLWALAIALLGLLGWLMVKLRM